MKEAIKNTGIKLDHVLIDAMPLDIDVDTTSIIKGDAKSISIAAASVIAKVTRDKMMYDLDKIYPMYDLAHNKGYGTKKHIEAIKKYGITKYHRLSYKPVSDYKDKVNDIEKELSKYCLEIDQSGLMTSMKTYGRKLLHQEYESLKDALKNL